MSYPELLRTYYVKGYDGQTEVTDQTYKDLIKLWLKPDRVPRLDNDPVSAIRQGLSFDLTRIRGGLLDEIFMDPSGGRIHVSTQVLEHFAKYPMRPAFNFDPWELLQGYIRSPDPGAYFFEITGESPQNFLNNTERIFYLTRGYGLPNPNISLADLKWRKFYMNASPTALIALSDFFMICPTRQDPNLILESLTTYPLDSIDDFHKKVVQKITDCLGTSRLCTGSAAPRTLQCDREGICIPNPTIDLATCSPDQVKCFRAFLERNGILGIFEYDPHFNVFVSNISELDLYKRVIPDKIWDPEEVKGMAPVYVETILSHLPDPELLKIIPNRVRDIRTRLRSHLMNEALTALLIPRWTRHGDIITYGRAIDPQKQYTLVELLESFEQNRAMIDPLGNPLDYESAASLGVPEINKWIYRTQALEAENKKRVSELPPGTKEVPEDLILWGRWSYPDKWIPVARRLSDEPVPANLLESTLEYYREIFPR